MAVSDRFKGKLVDVGVAGDSAVEGAGTRGGGGGGAELEARFPRRELTRSELEKLDKNGERFPPKAATATAAY